MLFSLMTRSALRGRDFRLAADLATLTNGRKAQPRKLLPHPQPPSYRLYYRGCPYLGFVRHLASVFKVWIDRTGTTMAPITDETVLTLQDTIAKLESRVHQLESKLGGGDGSSGKAAPSSKSIRMILMGPPGAGKRTGSVMVQHQLIFK